MSDAPDHCRTCGRPIGEGDRFCPRCGTDQQTGTGQPPQQASGSTWDAILERIRLAAAPKYQVLRILGYGGMAAVYLAREPKLGREVAIKVMSPTLMVDPKLVERFEQEARTIAQLHHPNIVTVYEVDERDGIHYFAMTYVAGRTLGQVMTEPSQPLPIPVVRAWLAQIGAALAYAHRAGVVHRDIKPANILLDRDGNVLVTDFGIAKVADEPSLTRTGQIIGTPSYMSPEQCSSGPVTGASDQYSLGAVAYHMVTGQPPFTGPTLAVLQAHVTQTPRSIQELRPDCPQDLRTAIERMLAKRPEDRFADVAAALDAVQAVAPGLNDPVRIPLTALAAHVVRVNLVSPPESLPEGMRRVLEAVPEDSNGRRLEGRPVRWSSSDRSVAQVGPDGKLLALQPGKVRITAASEGVSSSFELAVTPDPVEAVEVRLPQAWLSAGDAVMASAMVRGGRDSRPEERAVLWTSSDPAVARISASGVIEAVGPGTVTITVATGARSATAMLTVVDGRVAATATPAPLAMTSPPASPPKTVAPAAPTAPSAGAPLPAPSWEPRPAPDPTRSVAAAADTAGHTTPPVSTPLADSPSSEPAPARKWTTQRTTVIAASLVGVLGLAALAAFGLRNRQPEPPTAAAADGRGVASDGATPNVAATAGTDGGAGTGTAVQQAPAETVTASASAITAAGAPPTSSTTATPPPAPTPVQPPGPNPPSSASSGATARAGGNPAPAASPSTAQPGGVQSELDLARAEIGALVQRFEQAMNSRDLAQLRRIYAGATGNEAWWQFLAEGNTARVQIQLFQQSPITPLNNSALVVYSSRIVRYGSGGEVLAERPFVLQLQFNRQANGWSLASIR
jgi:serine/threonine protein kinase